MGILTKICLWTAAAVVLSAMLAGAAWQWGPATKAGEVPPIRSPQVAGRAPGLPRVKQAEEPVPERRLPAQDAAAGIDEAQPAKDSKTPAEVQTLLKARIVLAQKGYDRSEKSLGEVKRIGNMNILLTKPEEIHTWSVRWLQAERDTNLKKADDIAAVERHLARVTELAKKVNSLVPEVLPPIAQLDAEWYVLEAELWLVQTKANN